MDDFDKYTNGTGTIECPNDHVLANTIAGLLGQGLTESSSALHAPMTFRVVAQNPEGAIQLKSKYKIEHWGRQGTY